MDLGLLYPSLSFEKIFEAALKMAFTQRREERKGTLGH